ncbi:Zn(2)-C6 fungal-type domain-containing protein [Fusarium falciforme]|uniref:Zn(2)-C6 fungal-type domain-containing protein n=1 Tax=Fusarium falciforme TaxID=195108 RepID=UPI002301321D|nr:Zn(2)-C6 fungal-type domain-containing protein [Fusarium falciforme]WAO90020.1 Zn(2)-C6 fungal-type domain-containing protein [Fusarium falciforme]
MRSSLSCDHCRKAKIKCVNEGTAPCQKCLKLGNSGCELSRPQARSAKKIAARAQRATPELTPRADHVSTVASTPDVTRQDPIRPPRPSPSLSRRTVSSWGQEPVDEHLARLPIGVVLKALNIFTAKFPELRILQPSAFVKEYQSGRSRESKVLLATILAITRKQSSICSGEWLHRLRSSDCYASYAWSVLSNLILLPPNVQVVQALLILTLYEWGVREFHKAWMHCGMAIRIMQSLHSSRISPHALDISQNNDMDELAVVVETRTYWACFIMDCTINSGTYNPRMLPMPEMQKLKVPRPPNFFDFAFGSDGASLSQNLTANHSDPSGNLDLAQSFETIVLGFDIYAQAMAFVFNNGRCAPGMCAPENCPWVPGSLWSNCRNRLEEWRGSQHHRLHYPRHSVAVHMTLGHGESFIYLNMLYYLSTIMLHREYFPFLPTAESTPQGPIHPPLLEAEAPPGWWEDSAKELYGAAEQIACLLQEASECGIPLMTPFSGFCAFTACFLNLYIFRFPKMNLGRSPRAEQLMNWGLEYLEEFQNAWELAGGWIKTIQNSSLLYKSATEDSGRFRGRSRADFETLHQSIHEYRIVDRSDLHLQQIRRADRNSSRENENDERVGREQAQVPIGMNPAGNPAFLDPFPNWWSMLQEVEFAEISSMMN